jgi:hypothetical protein
MMPGRASPVITVWQWEVCKKQGGIHLMHTHGKAAVEFDVWQGAVVTELQVESVQACYHSAIKYTKCLPAGMLKASPVTHTRVARAHDQL